MGETIACTRYHTGVQQSRKRWERQSSVHNVVQEIDGYVALRVGHLVKDESFTLYESVGALEVRPLGKSNDKSLFAADAPKMDSGFIAKDKSHEEEYDVLRKLSPRETIGIMDQLLCFEVRL